MSGDGSVTLVSDHPSALNLVWYCRTMALLPVKDARRPRFDPPDRPPLYTNTSMIMPNKILAPGQGRQ